MARRLLVFEVTPSLTNPLRQITEIKTEGWIKSMLRKDHELLLGGDEGWLEVFNMSSATITNSRQIIADRAIYDILAIDETHFLLVSYDGILKSTKD
jgi:hypothetical protein